jgi:hypothetical protein
MGLNFHKKTVLDLKKTALKMEKQGSFKMRVVSWNYQAKNQDTKITLCFENRALC